MKQIEESYLEDRSKLNIMFNKGIIDESRRLIRQREDTDMRFKCILFQ